MDEEKIIKYIAGQVTSEEEIEILNQINRTEENKEKYSKYLNLWALSSQKRIFAQASSGDIQRFKEAISDKKKLSRSRVLKSILQYAAIALIALLTGKYLIPHQDRQDLSTLKNQIIVPLGSKSKIILPDGTLVSLNSGSKLVYDFSYGKSTRQIMLQGEAYFKVAKQKERPFIVQTSNARIQATGTEFNVKAYPEEKRTETILVEGTIIVQKLSFKRNALYYASKGIVLKPGQKMMISAEDNRNQIQEAEKENERTSGLMEEKEANGKITELQNAYIETSWKDDRWIIEGQKLDDLAVLLSRNFNVNIQLMDSTLKEYKFSGTIQNETIEQIFDIMKFAVPMTYTIEKGNVKWFINTKLEKEYKEVYKKKN